MAKFRPIWSPWWGAILRKRKLKKVTNTLLLRHTLRLIIKGFVNGAMTLCIITFSIMTLSIMTLSIMTLSIMTLSIMKLS